MTKKLIRIFVLCSMISLLISGVVAPTNIVAISHNPIASNDDTQDDDSPNTTSGESCTDPISCINTGIDNSKEGQSTKTIPEIVGDIISTALFVTGIISVIIIIYAGIRYITSAGDSSKVTSAKNILMYSVIGLVISILAYAIVRFVVTNIK